MTETILVLKLVLLRPEDEGKKRNKQKSERLSIDDLSFLVLECDIINDAVFIHCHLSNIYHKQKTFR